VPPPVELALLPAELLPDDAEPLLVVPPPELLPLEAPVLPSPLDEPLLVPSPAVVPPLVVLLVGRVVDELLPEELEWPSPNSAVPVAPHPSAMHEHRAAA
jgi:hypothetical protein